MLRLVFTTSNDWFSLGVRAFTQSDVAHVAIGLGAAGEHLLHVRSKKGVIIEPRRKFRQRTLAEYAILRDVRPGLAFCLSQLGRPYDFDEVSSRPVLTALRALMPLAPEDNRTPGAWNCARFVMCLDPSGASLTEWQRLDPMMVTPAELHEACTQGLNFARIG